MNGADFLRGVVAAFPYAIHTVLTDNGMAFADLPKNRNGLSRRYLEPHIFDRVCQENGIEHKLTKAYHPWANGQVERMNRTIKEATIKVFHYADLESLKAHVLAFVSAYNFAKHLKALKWRTPFEAVCNAWTTTPDIFKINPRHLIPGPNTLERKLFTPVTGRPQPAWARILAELHPPGAVLLLQLEKLATTANT